MTREKCEARRRRLDEALCAALEMLKAGHQSQVPKLAPSAPPPEARNSPEAP